MHNYDHYKTTEPYQMSKYDEYTTEEIEDLVNECDRLAEKNSRLEQLNAELSEMLRKLYKDRSGRIDVEVRAVIAKAEGRKE